MTTKKNTTAAPVSKIVRHAAAAPVETPAAATVEKVSLLSEKDFISYAEKSGTPALKSFGNVGSRVYANPTFSGTTAFIIAALSTVDTKRTSFTVADFDSGIRSMKTKENWERLDAIFNTFRSRFASNRKGEKPSLASKYKSPVKSLRTSGVYKAFDVSAIGTPELRKSFGFAAGK